MLSRALMQGRVKVSVNGEVVYEGRNTVTSLGLEKFAAFIGNTASDRPSHMAFGDDDTQPLESQTALVGTEHFRKAVVTTVTGNQVKYTSSPAAGERAGAYTIKEMGIFNAGVGGTMFCRFVCQEFTLAVADTLVVEWTILLEEE